MGINSLNEVKSIARKTELADKLLAMLKAEWPELQSLGDTQFERYVPDPIAVVLEGDVIGGLSYINFRAPDTGKVALWINAVFVRKKYRRRGFATQMLQVALKTRSCLYARTEFPELYTNLGFRAIQTDRHGVVVKFVAPATPLRKYF